MLNVISAEWMKMRKNKIFLVCSLVVLLSAIVIVIKDLFFVDAPTNYTDWLLGSAMVTALFLPIMSGFIITFLVQREYEDKTIINVLTAPTYRIVFLFSKLMIWFLWYIVILIATEGIYIVGGVLIFSGEFGFEGVKILTQIFTKYGLLNFIASFSLLWVAIRQKKIFYPSVMVALVYTGIGLSALNMPLKIASIIPWSAVSVLSFFDAPAPYSMIGMVSILLMGSLGLFLAYVSFEKQDQ